MTESCVLIVSEEDGLSARFGDILLRDGYEVSTAKDVEECFARLDEGNIGTVLVDADLGDDGPTRILERVGTLWPNLPVILVARENAVEEAMRRTAFAASDYLSKNCGELSLRFRVTKAYQRYEETLSATSRGGADFQRLERDLQESVDELSCLYSICQVIGRDTPLDSCLRSVTRLLAQGMRSSTSAVVEIWLDGKRYSEFPELSERTCEISAPVVVGDEERGRLVVYSCRATSFSPREVAMVTNTARKVGYTVRRSELRRALFASESKHRRLLEAVTEGVFWAHFVGEKGIVWGESTDKEALFASCLNDLRITDCNLAFASFYGFASVKECIGAPLGRFFKDADAGRRYLEQLFERGRVSQLITRRKPDGSERVVEMVSHLIRRAGKIMGIQGINFERFPDEELRIRSEGRAALAPQQALLSHVLDIFPEGVAVYDANGRCIACNSAMPQLFGHHEQEFKRLHYLSLLPGDIQAELAGREETRGTDGTPEPYRVVLTGRSGDRLAVSLQRIPASADSPAVSILIARDLSKSKERQLDAGMLERLFDGCRYGVLVADLSGCIIYASRFLVEMLGLNERELIGADLSVLHVEGQGDLERDVETQTVKNGSWAGEIQRYGRSNEPLTVYLVTWLVRGEAGETIGQVHLYSDITDQKKRLLKLEHDAENLHRAIEQRTRELLRSEESRRRAYRLAPIGIAITTVSGTLRDANDELCEMLKYAREELVEKNLASICREQKQYESLLSEIMSNGKLLDREVEYLASDGTVVTVEQSSVMMEGEEGEALITHFLKDVTQAKKMAAEAEERQRQIIRADKLASLGQLVAGVAHELNNPLTAVLTYGHLLRRKTGENDERRESLDNIIEAGERCRQIVKKLLDFAHEREPAKTSTNLNDVVRHVLDIMRNQMLIRKVKVTMRLEPELPPAWVDPHEMEQVFLNICVNAVEAMDGGGQLTVASRYDAEKDMIRLEFRDTGSGISPEHLERIFEPFFTTKEVGKGTGLGLAVSQRIVNDHNGTIRVESTPGEGSLFSVCLPVAEPSSEDD